MRLITGNNNLAYGPIPKTDAINLLILNNTKGRDLLKFQEYQNTLYQEYELQEVVNTCRVTAIEQVVSTQYIEEKQKEYVGYNNKTIRLLLDHVQTWAIITNRDNIEAKAHFHAP